MVKYYHIIAFEEPVTLDQDNPTFGHYMGKTSDLAFKTEPDKTIDLDDGTTIVGSEKLSLSFTCLEKLQNPWPLKELWLISGLPTVDRGVAYSFVNHNNYQIVSIDLRGVDYHLEAGSGDFEKILFSANFRYAVDNPPYRSYDDYFSDDWTILLGRLQDPYNGDEVQLIIDSTAAVLDMNDMLVEYCFACVGIDAYYMDPTIAKYGDSICDLYGAPGVNWWHPDGNV